MGLKNKEDYKLTTHFINRFRERFNVEYNTTNFNRSLNKMLDSINLIVEKKNYQYYKDDKYFLVADKVNKKLVTIYGVNEPEDKFNEEDLELPLLETDFKEGLGSVLEEYANKYLLTQNKEIREYSTSIHSKTKKIKNEEDLESLLEEVNLLKNKLEDVKKLYSKIKKHDLV